MATPFKLNHTDLPASLRDLVSNDELRIASEKTQDFIRTVGLNAVTAGIGAALGHWFLAGAMAAVGGTALALKMITEHLAHLPAARLDAPGGQRVTSGALAKFEAGIFGVDRGLGWAVYESPGSAPRIMSDDEYAEFRETAPQVVEVSFEDGGYKVARFSCGLPDSAATGLPSIEVFSKEGDPVRSDWAINGEASTMEEALKANAAYAAGPSPAPGAAPSNARHVVGLGAETLPTIRIRQAKPAFSPMPRQ